jgi:hypothetical protein
METTIYSEPSQSNQDEYPWVADGLVIDYTPQMNITNSFTRALPELQYDQLLHYCVSTDSPKTKTPWKKGYPFLLALFPGPTKIVVRHTPGSTQAFFFTMAFTSDLFVNTVFSELKTYKEKKTCKNGLNIVRKGCVIINIPPSCDWYTLMNLP